MNYRFPSEEKGGSASFVLQSRAWMVGARDDAAAMKERGGSRYLRKFIGWAFGLMQSG